MRCFFFWERERGRARVREMMGLVGLFAKVMGLLRLLFKVWYPTYVEIRFILPTDNLYG